MPMPRRRPDPATWHGSSAVTVSKGELAAELGLSAGRISQMIATGLPIRPDGAVDLAAACMWALRHLQDAKAHRTREAAADGLRSALMAAEDRRRVRAAAEIVAASASTVAAESGMPATEADRLADAALVAALPALNVLLRHDCAMPLPPPPPGAWRRADGDPADAVVLLSDVVPDPPRPKMDPDLAAVRL